MSNTDKQKKPILIVINKLGKGGAEKQLLLIVRNLLHKYEFSILLIHGEGELAGDFRALGISITCLDLKGSLFHPLNLARLAGFMLRNRPSRPALVHTWLYHSNLVGAIFRTAGFAPRLIISVRGSNFWFKTHHRLLNRFCERMCDRIVTNSLQLEQEIRSHSVHGDRIRVIPNGIEIPANTPEPRPGGEIVIGSVGRFVSEKKYDDTIEAARILLQHKVKFRLVLVGGRGNYDTFRKQVEAGELRNHVEFTGEVDTPMEFIRDFDIFLMTSSHEGMPNALMEAMTLARPVVATRAGSIPELVDPGVNGELVAVGDPAAIARALIRLIDDPGRRARYGMASLQKIKNYSIEKLVDRYDRLYCKSTTHKT